MGLKHHRFLSENRINYCLEAGCQFFRRFLPVSSDPPLYHFYETSGNMIQKEILRYLRRACPSLKEQGNDEPVQAVLEIAEENITAVRGEKIAYMIGIVINMLQQMAEYRIRDARIIFGITGLVIMHDPFDDMVKELTAHLFQKAVLRFEMGVESAPADICPVDNILNRNLMVCLFR